MRFKCWDCGKYFNEYNISHEDRGEFWGIPCFEDVPVCPYCGGDFDEAETVEQAEMEGN